MAVAKARSTVTEAEREKFERDGYLVIDDLGYSDALLDGIVADLDGLYEGDERRVDDVFYARHRIGGAWRISENVKGLALHPNVLALVEDLYGRKPLPFETLDFRMGTEQPTHSDTIHFNSMPRGFMCGVWVALEDIDMENGPVVYYPGSHKLPEITLEDVGPDADEAAYSRYIAAMIERLELKPRVRHDPQGADVHLGEQPSPRRIPPDRHVAHPVQPGHAFLLRRLQVLGAAPLEGRRDSLGAPELDQLDARRPASASETSSPGPSPPERRCSSRAEETRRS